MTGAAWHTTAPGDAVPDLHLQAPSAAVVEDVLTRLIEDRVASRLLAEDATLWGESAQSEASKRLAWVHLPTSSRALYDELAALAERARSRGLTRIVLCGMGGSSLAPEVIAGSLGGELVVLDSSHPDMVRHVVGTDLKRTLVVISSKSGGTVETDSHRRVFVEAFTDAGLDPAERIVVVTDPGSPLAEEAAEAGHQVVLADPQVGGRYSALSAFGLVPTALAGVDVAPLLDQAEALVPRLGSDSADNPGLLLGAWLGAAVSLGVDKLVLADHGSAYPGLGDWAEQLIAESTGKHGTGILPVAMHSPDTVARTADTVLVGYGSTDTVAEWTGVSGWAGGVDLPLGAQFLLWEFATAVAGRLLGINPFDQPDVESAKAAAREHLDGADPEPAPAFVDGAVAVHASPGLLPEGCSTVLGAVEALLATLDPDHGYLALEAFLDRLRDQRFEAVRHHLVARTRRPVTFGWGPRFLHSTGQYHKGGPATGVHLQVTGLVTEDLAVPDRPFTFGEFIAAQAIGDSQVLSSHGRPVLRLHVDTTSGLDQVMEALQ